MPSVKDVARLAGVSAMTVSRALNNPEKLGAETLTRIQSAIQTLGYVPDLAARRIRGGRSSGKTIGVFALGTATTPFAVDLLLGLERTTREHGWNLFILNLLEDRPSPEDIELMLAHRPDGIVFSSMYLRALAVPSGLGERPVVLSNCYAEGAAVACYVPDDAEGQYQAVRTALARGYRRPLSINLPRPSPAWPLRQEGLLRACREAGLADDALGQYDLSTDDAYDETRLELERRFATTAATPDLLICGNDRIALVAYQWLLARGLRIPQDVAVLGYDNMVGVAELFHPPLTTVQLPHFELGREAALHLIEGRANDRARHQLACPLVDRASL
ncbi:sucrose operon repressor [Pseudomonas oryzihabitans]|nr:transcriptional regulator [Pseudomonas psychrotolerans]KTS76889.1 sucrose operon repressor [Pseudomonas psychrotolerans]KTT11340.1 sucrose operon repressor [Pseudomonas psychrotolerans]KTT38472.1 sucrose operon repressor [Pseudomonas psychrotolerans]KTT45778.1 sucrose operon repressor [Pseudomonas psychrotolerans]